MRWPLNVRFTIHHSKLIKTDKMLQRHDGDWAWIWKTGHHRMQTCTQRLVISMASCEVFSDESGQLCWATVLHAWDNWIQSFSVSGVHQARSQAKNIQTNYLVYNGQLYFISHRRYPRLDVSMQTCMSPHLTHRKHYEMLLNHIGSKIMDPRDIRKMSS